MLGLSFYAKFYAIIFQEMQQAMEAQFHTKNKARLVKSYQV
ncbi:hypothetical protein MCACP_20830 [Neomoorella carbonis]